VWWAGARAQDGSAAASPPGEPLELERVVSCASAESMVPELALPAPISKFETELPDHEALGARAVSALGFALNCMISNPSAR